MISWVFPGQGSQSVGMVAGEAQPAIETWATAREILGWDLRSVCHHGPAELLVTTTVAQPAILTASVAAARALESTGMTPDLVAGHSVGELAALVCARALTFEDALFIVTVRAGAMARAGEDSPGGMAAVIGLPVDRVREICAQTAGIVVVANVNTTDQIVISGEDSAVKKAAESARAAGGRRVIPLAISVAAHSPLMSRAAEELERELGSVTLLEPVIPFASSITGDFVMSPTEIKRELVRAMMHPVVWPACVETLRSAGTDLFVEVGPGRVLTGLIRRIIPGARIASVPDEKAAIAFAHDRSAGVIG